MKEENILKDRKIKPTAVRLLVLRQLMEIDKAVSLKDLEQILVHSDKSTIFRTLKTFQENFLVHRINDGTGAVKYALCEDDCVCSLEDNHMHFLCIKCEKTYCLKSTPVRTPELPDGFIPKYANYLIEGVCSRCS